MASRHQFAQEERILPSALKRRGLTQKEIARELGKHQSSISREIRRNKKEHDGHHAGHAKRAARERGEAANADLKRIENNPWLKRCLVRKLKRRWSPEQIAGRVRKDREVIVRHETICRFICHARPDLKKCLRCQKGKYRRRYGAKMREIQREEAKKKRIDTRPEIIEQRQRLGDFEGDTMMGRRGAGSLVARVDRRSGYTLIDHLAQAAARAVRARKLITFQIPLSFPPPYAATG